MIRKLIFSIAAATFSIAVMSQAKKPTLMVIPSDQWCVKKGYVTTFDNGGQQIAVPDYKTALQKDAELLLACSKIGELMAERGFPLKDLGATIKSIESSSVESQLLTSQAGTAIAESPLDRIKRTAKADILIQINCDVAINGPKKTLTFVMQGLDAYTNKQIASASGVGAPSFAAEVAMLLQEAVLTHIDNFNNQLQAHFDDMFANGREIKVVLKRFDSSPINFESQFDYNGQTAELADIIGVWFEENTVNTRFSEASRSTNELIYEQVRIPVMTKSLSGREVGADATTFVRTLATMLEKEPYSVPVKRYVRGLGEVWLILGEK